MRTIASPRRATVSIEELTAEKQVTPLQAKSKSIVGKTLLVTVVMITGAFLVLAVAELAYKIALFVKEKSLGKKCKVDAETHDFFKPLLAQLEVCTQWQASEVHQRFSMATDDERKVLLYLKNHYEISDQTMEQIYYGAHVTLEDKGESYKYFDKKLIKKRIRQSSHPSRDEQFAVRGKLVSEMLFGTTLDGNTWFQMEKTPLAFGSVLSHFFDYCCFLILRKNVGPQGYSAHTDRNSLIIKAKKCSV